MGLISKLVGRGSLYNWLCPYIRDETFVDLPIMIGEPGRWVGKGGYLW